MQLGARALAKYAQDPEFNPQQKEKAAEEAAGGGGSERGRRRRKNGYRRIKHPPHAWNFLEHLFNNRSTL